MSSDNEGQVLAYSDSAFSRGVMVGGNEPVTTTAPAQRSNQIWITGPEAAPSRAPATAPSIAHVEAVTQGRIEGESLEQFRGGGILQTFRDGKTGDLLGNRAPTLQDRVTITTGSGRQMEVRVAQAVAEGFLFQAADGSFREADRAAQKATVEEMAKLEAAKAESEKYKYEPEVEKGIRSISDAMAAEGLNFGDAIAEWIGSEGASVSEPVAQFASNHGFSAQQQLAAYLSQMRSAVVTTILQPQGISPEDFMAYLENPMNRPSGTRAALLAHHGRSLEGFRQLARAYLDTGGRRRR
jgi:hypothetical protein